MNEPLEQDRVATAHDNRGRIEAERGRASREEMDLGLDLDSALDGEHVDLKPVVQYLASRVWEAEHRLARLGRRMEEMKRRFGELESQLSRMASRSSEHEESLRMMCAVLTDLDDPYGFGLSLDERLAYDEADRTTEEEA